MLLTLRSPAKINLFLRALRKREDGYHEIASLMQTISLYDTLRMRIAQQDRFTCDDPGLPLDSSNLVIQALEKFRFVYKKDFHVHINLEKRIPVQAGLGGGSSNAATTLWGLNALLGNPLSLDQLSELGAEIGSDVAFFLSEGTAYCRGRGEIVEPIIHLPPQELWIVKPLEGLSTPLVYQALNLEALQQRNPEESIKSIAIGEKEYYNDLEIPAFQLLPRLLEIKEQLLASGFSQVVLCGSGTALFCVGDGIIPNIVGIASVKVEFINRPPEKWYE